LLVIGAWLAVIRFLGRQFDARAKSPDTSSAGGEAAPDEAELADAPSK
jgi:hypothetical protein